jgi:hypothetical protein
MTIPDLIALAADLRLPEDALDDVVRDLTDRAASAAVNDDPRPDITDAQDDHYGTWDAVAADVNNGGHAAQIQFLVDQLGAEQTARVLREATR